MMSLLEGVGLGVMNAPCPIKSTWVLAGQGPRSSAPQQCAARSSRAQRPAALQLLRKATESVQALSSHPLTSDCGATLHSSPSTNGRFDPAESLQPCGHSSYPALNLCQAPGAVPAPQTPVLAHFLSANYPAGQGILWDALLLAPSSDFRQESRRRRPPQLPLIPQPASLATRDKLRSICCPGWQVGLLEVRPLPRTTTCFWI